jgi:hypothetical protein
VRHQPRRGIRASDEARYVLESRHGYGVLRRWRTHHALHGEPDSVPRFATSPALCAAVWTATGNGWEPRRDLCTPIGKRLEYALRLRLEVRLSWLALVMKALRFFGDGRAMMPAPCCRISDSLF